MKKQLATFALALLVGLVGFAAAGVAVAANEKPPSPPGQGECEHGNSGKPCRDDPQPEKGKDCEEHGNQGGVNEDHCKGADTTTTDTTDTTDTTTTDSTTTDSTTTDSTTTDSTTTDSTTTDSTTTDSPKILGTPPVTASKKNKEAVLGTGAGAPKPTRQPQEAPFTL